MKTRILIAAVTFLCAASMTSCVKMPQSRVTEASNPSAMAAPGTANPASGTSATRMESGRIPIRLSLFICCQYSTGVPPDQTVVDDFNASQDKIQLIRDICCDINALAAKFASGDGPDIVGPMGWSTADHFRDQWLDLAPLIQAANYDVTQFNPALMKMYATPEGQVSLPFAVNPSVVFYNTRLFAKAGLAYPPATYGEKYRMPNGSEVDWSWETVQEVARMLTLDADGRNAAESGLTKTTLCNTDSPGNMGITQTIGVLSGRPAACLPPAVFPATIRPRFRTSGKLHGNGRITGFGETDLSWRTQP